MSSLLEDRYRRALRLLPPSYRSAWEEDMVATFLERAYAAAPDDPEGVELSSPSRAELASVATLAVRLWLGGVGAAPRYFAWGEAMRRVALAGLLAYAAGALVSVAIRIWVEQRLPGLAGPAPASRPGALLTIVNLLWVPAYLLLLYGQTRAARYISWAAVAPIVISAVARLTADHGAFAISRTFDLVFAILPVVALAAFHQSAPPIERRPWLIGLAVGTVLTLAVFVVSQPFPEAWVLVDWATLWCAGVLAAALWLLRPWSRTALRQFRTGSTTPWILALAVLGWGALGLRVTTVIDYGTFLAPTPERSLVVSVGIAEAVVVFIATVTLTAVAARSMRRLPTVPPTPTAH
jgi:hypothetical protein